MKRHSNKILQLATSLSSRQAAFIFALVGVIVQAFHTYYITNELSSLSGFWRILQALLMAGFISCALLYFTLKSSDEDTKAARRYRKTVWWFAIIETFINLYYWGNHLLIQPWPNPDYGSFIIAVPFSILIPFTLKVYAGEVRTDDYSDVEDTTSDLEELRKLKETMQSQKVDDTISDMDDGYFSDCMNDNFDPDTEQDEPVEGFNNIDEVFDAFGIDKPDMQAASDKPDVQDIPDNSSEDAPSDEPKQEEPKFHVGDPVAVTIGRQLKVGIITSIPTTNDPHYWVFMNDETISVDESDLRLLDMPKYTGIGDEIINDPHFLMPCMNVRHPEGDHETRIDFTTDAYIPETDEDEPEPEFELVEELVEETEQPTQEVFTDHDGIEFKVGDIVKFKHPESPKENGAYKISAIEADEETPGGFVAQLMAGNEYMAYYQLEALEHVKTSDEPVAEDEIEQPTPEIPELGKDVLGQFANGGLRSNPAYVQPAVPQPLVNDENGLFDYDK